MEDQKDITQAPGKADHQSAHSPAVLERRVSRGNSIGSANEPSGASISSSPGVSHTLSRSRSSKDSFELPLATVAEEHGSSKKLTISTDSDTKLKSSSPSHIEKTMSADFTTNGDEFYTTTLNDASTDNFDVNAKLPEGWSSYFDETYQTNYYVNNLNGKTQWEYPLYPASQSPLHSKLPHSSSGSYHKSSAASSSNNLKSRSQSYDEFMLEEGIIPVKNASKSNSRSSIQWIGSEDHYDFEFPEEAALPLDVTADQRRQSSSPASMLHEDNANSNINNNPTEMLPSPQERFEEKVFVKKRESTTVNQHLPGGKNQDYLALARLYKIQRPYADPNYLAMCLLCHKYVVEDAFFPCEHHCVCRRCLKKEKICCESDLRKMPDGYINCSLCAGIIKLILPLENGKEINKYWEWVYEEKVELPKGFMRNFRHSAAIIQKVYIDEKHHNEDGSGMSSLCIIS